MLENKPDKAMLIAGAIVLTVAAMIVVPLVVNAISRKVYRKQNTTSDIDFDDMGPEIVRKDAAEKKPEDQDHAEGQE